MPEELTRTHAFIVRYRNNPSTVGVKAMDVYGYGTTLLRKYPI